MPKMFKYKVGDRVEVVNVHKESDLYKKKGKIVGLREVGAYDYNVEFEDGSVPAFFLENELTKLNEYNIPEIGDLMRVKATGEKGIVVQVDLKHRQVELEFEYGMGVKGFDKVELVEEDVKGMETIDVEGYFQKLGNKVGELVDLKQQAYGDSVSKTYKLMQIFLEQYDNGDNTYTIPKSLLKHILLQVRKIDKANRIFSNPDGDLMGENPYQDDVGYSLLGMRMVEGGE